MSQNTQKSLPTPAPVPSLSSGVFILGSEGVGRYFLLLSCQFCSYTGVPHVSPKEIEPPNEVQVSNDRRVPPSQSYSLFFVMKTLFLHHIKKLT